VTYRLLAGDPLDVTHYGEPVRLAVGSDVALDVPPPPRLGPIRQPAGRAPTT
jgi:alpha,alpha-trehalose phosphorylase